MQLNMVILLNTFIGTDKSPQQWLFHHDVCSYSEILMVCLETACGFLAEQKLKVKVGFRLHLIVVCGHIFTPGLQFLSPVRHSLCLSLSLSPSACLPSARACCMSWDGGGGCLLLPAFGRNNKCPYKESPSAHKHWAL